MSLDNEDNVENRCSEFCRCFISIGVSSLKNYNEVALGQKEKRGKWMSISELAMKGGSQIIGAVIGGCVSMEFSGAMRGAQGGSFIATIASKCLDPVFSKDHKKKAKKISERLGYFSFVKNDRYDYLIEVFTHVAVQIFASFEWQFMHISGDSWKHSMHKLAIDAIDRTMNYIYVQELSPIVDLSILKEVLIKGIIYGKSKDSVFSNITPSSLQGLHVRSMITPHPGKTFQSIDDKFTSCDVWEKPGVIADGKIFYSDQCDINKFGYRHLFQFENIADFPLKGPGNSYGYKIYNDFEKYKDNILQEFASPDKIITDTIYKKLAEEGRDLLKVFIDEFKNIITSLLTPSPILDEHWIGKFWPQRNCLINSFVIRFQKQGMPIVDHIKERINIAGELVITGCVGVGKSTLAIWFSDHYQNCFDNIIWIDCRNKDYLLSCIVLLATSLKIADPDKKSLPILASEIYRKFQSIDCLFIFDGAADYMTLKSILPNKNNSNKIISLITSRHDVWGQQSDFGEMESFKLQSFSDSEAMKFLTGKHALGTASATSDVQELARTLHNHPLALRQTVAFINKLKKIDPNYDVHKCLKDFESNPQMILQAHNLDDYSQSIYNAFMQGCEQIKENQNYGELAMTILAIIAYLECGSIDYDLFNELGEDSMVLEALYLLKQYSVINIVSPQKKCFCVCPLYQLIIMLMNKKYEENYLKMALTCFNDSSSMIHLDKVFKYANNYPNLLLDFKLLHDKLMTPIGCEYPSLDINYNAPAHNRC